MRLILTLLFVLTACAGAQTSEHAASLEVTQQDGSRGGMATLVLTNRSREPLGYNLCTSVLELQTGSAWELVPSNRVCTMELRTLRAGERVEYAVRSAATGTGEYRYRTSVEWFESGTRSFVASQPFHIR